MGSILTYNGKILTSGAKWVGTPIDPYNPLDLPGFTIRLRYTNGVTPTFSYGTAVQVSSSPNIWDLTYDGGNSHSWEYLLRNHTELLEVIGANTRSPDKSSHITNMYYMFAGCTALTTVAVFDTSYCYLTGNMFGSCSSLATVGAFPLQNVLNANTMFGDCTSITTLPDFDFSSAEWLSGTFLNCSSLTAAPGLTTTSALKYTQYLFDGCSAMASVGWFNTESVIWASAMFRSCNALSGNIPAYDCSSMVRVDDMFYWAVNVDGGFLDIYNQLKDNPVEMYSRCFEHCGENSPTGAQELAQIPASWGGTGA